jgi:DNA-binding winged helix-turn-helix (wHTH) protein
MTVRFGACVLDRERREVRRDGEAVHLSPKAFELLLALLESRPRPLSKVDLHRRLWPSTFVHEANLPNLVAELRLAIGDDARRPRFVATVHSFGYAFSGPAAEGDAAAADEDEPRPFLYCISGGHAIATIVDGEHVLGRGHQSVIALSEASVSRRHARLRVCRGQAILEDLASRHGTFVRGERLTGPARLDDGDEFILGTVRLAFRVLRARDLADTR